MKIELRIACALAVLSPFALQAQTERSGSDTARVMQQVQQLTSEKTKLQTDNDQLKKEVESLKEQVTKLQGEQGALQRKAQASEAAAARSSSTAETNSAALERARAQTQELVEKFREMASNLSNVEIAKRNTEADLAGREQNLKTCVDRNVGLYDLNSEILTRMEDRGFWSGLGEREPFTRIARTRLENLIDDYRYRVEELRLQKQPADAGSAPVAAK